MWLVSGMLSPVGPEDPAVYWRRRGAVILVLLALLWLVYWLLSSLFGSDGAAAQQAVPPPTSEAASASASATPSAEDQAAAKKAAAEKAAAEKAAAERKAAEQAAAEKKAAAEKAAAEKAAAEPPRCADSDLQVLATPAAVSTAVGKGMDVTLSITNKGSKACQRNLTAAVNEVRIVSGRVLVWSSNYCRMTDDGEPAKAAATTLQPGTTWSAKVTWPGNVTAADCPAQQPVARAGAYRAIGHTGDLWSPESAFVVR